jgi:hypothetical protein
LNIKQLFPGSGGSNLTKEHQQSAGRKLRPKRIPKKAVAAAQLSDETFDEAALRYQRARADTTELEREKRQLELDVARGKLVTRDEAVDLAQAAVLRVVAILDRLPERARDLGHAPSPEELEAIILECRSEVARG